MESLIIAKKNLKMLFRNGLFILFLTVVPIFMIYFMKMSTDSAAIAINNSAGAGLVEMIFLKSNTDDFLVQTFQSGLLVQFLLLASVIAGAMIVGEREENTLMRMFIAPVSKLKILTGMLIGHLVFVMIVASAIILGTHIISDIYWGSSWGNIMIVTLFAVYVGTSLAFIVSGIFKKGKTAGAVMSIVVIAMTFLSGGFVQGEHLDVISKFTVNRWISDAYTKLMSGGSFEDILINISILAIMGTVFMFIALIIYRKENIYE